MLFFVKVLVSGFRTPFTLHQVPESLFLNGGIKEFVHLKKKKKKNLNPQYNALASSGGPGLTCIKHHGSFWRAQLQS